MYILTKIVQATIQPCMHPFPNARSNRSIPTVQPRRQSFFTLPTHVASMFATMDGCFTFSTSSGRHERDRTSKLLCVVPGQAALHSDHERRLPLPLESLICDLSVMPTSHFELVTWMLRTQQYNTHND